MTKASGLRLAKRMARLGTETAFEVLVKARALEATGRDIVHLEIGEPDFEMDDVAALCFERSRFHQDFERGLGAETRHTLGEAKFPSLSHDGEISIINALAQLVFFLGVAIAKRVWFQNLRLTLRMLSRADDRYWNVRNFAGE